MKKRVLCLLVAGFEEIETIAPIDLLRRAEAEVVIASVSGEKLVAGRCGIVVQAETGLTDVAEQAFDLLFIPGGPGVMALRKDGRGAKLAQSYIQQGKPVAAICAAPLVLMDAGLLEGKRFTAYHSVREELGGGLDERVVVDGDIITSRGAGTALDFALVLVDCLCGPVVATQVADEIMV